MTVSYVMGFPYYITRGAGYFITREAQVILSRRAAERKRVRF